MLKHSGIFVTGTDTDIGKTAIVCGLLVALKKQNIQSIALKPIASDCEMTPEGLRNNEALALQKYSHLPLDYDWINPIRFAEPISPHIAASDLSVDIVLQASQKGFSVPRDFIIVEGVGGWEVPISETETMADIAKAINFPIVLVVGMRLGCVNHSLLTVANILQNSNILAGWIANVIDPEMLYLDQNIRSLEKRIPAPLIGTVPFQKNIDPEVTATYLDLSFLCASKF